MRYLKRLVCLIVGHRPPVKAFGYARRAVACRVECPRCGFGATGARAVGQYPLPRNLIGRS